MTDVPALGDIHAMSIDKMKDQLGGLNLDQLVQLRGLETGAGGDQQRAGAVAAIDAAIAKFPAIHAGNVHVADGMVPYIGTKILNAKPMDRQTYVDYRGWTLPDDENGEDAGYLVEYTDGGSANMPEFSGYVSWSPADVFDGTYRLLQDGEQTGDIDFWQESARQYSRDADYYRDLVEQIGKAIGDVAFIADDGSVSDSVLNAKVPELVISRLAEVGQLTNKVAELEQKLRDAGKPTPGPDPVLVPGDPVQAGPIVKFYDGDVEIEAAGYMLTEQRDWAIVNGATVLNRKIAISRDLPRVTITHVRIVGEDGEPVASCEIPGGLRVGAGVQAELPAQSLAFIATAQPLVDADA